MNSDVREGRGPGTRKDGPRSAAAAPLRSRFPDKVAYMNALLVLSVITYLPGIFFPIASIKKSLGPIPLGGNSFSLAGVVGALFGKGEIPLALLVFGFTIAFPCAKLFTLFRLWHHPFENARAEILSHRLAVIGKWSMLDVFVISVFVALVKIDGLAHVEVYFPIYFFALSVVLTMVATSSIARMMKAVAQ